MQYFSVRSITSIAAVGLGLATIAVAPAHAQNAQQNKANEKSIIIVGGQGQQPADKVKVDPSRTIQTNPSITPNSAQTKALNPQPLPPKETPSITPNSAQTKALNPQPLPPKESMGKRVQ
jgi:hypothetical protein